MFASMGRWPAPNARNTPMTDNIDIEAVLLDLERALGITREDHCIAGWADWSALAVDGSWH